MYWNIKMIKKIVTALFLLYSGVNAQDVEYQLRGVKNVSFDITIHLRDDQKIILNSDDERWDVLVHQNEKRFLGATCYWSMYAREGGKRVALFSDIRIKNVPEFLKSLLSGVMAGDAGERKIKTLNENFTLGIALIEEGSGIFYQIENPNKKSVSAYTIELPELFEVLGGFYERIMSVWPPMYREMEQGSKSSIVETYLNQQICFLMRECDEPSMEDKKRMLDTYYGLDVQMKEELLLGVNLKFQDELYHPYGVENLFYRYFESAENVTNGKKVIKRFKIFMIEKLKDQLSPEAFDTVIKKLTLVSKNKILHAQLTALRLELEEAWNDYHPNLSAKSDKTYLPLGVKKLVAIKNIDFMFDFKREGKEDVHINASKRAWRFTMSERFQDEDYTHKLSSSELMFPKEVYFSMMVDGTVLAKTVRAKDFLRFFRSINAVDFSVGSTRIIPTLDPSFSLGVSRISKESMIIYNAKTLAQTGIAYSIDASKVFTLDYEVGFFTRKLMRNEDGRLYENYTDLEISDSFF